VSNSRLHNVPSFTKRSGLPDAVAACGLAMVASGQLSDARRLAEQAMGRSVAPLSALRRLTLLAPGSILVFESKNVVTGVLGVLPLTEAGLRRLLGGSLELTDPRRSIVANTFDQAFALYAMGIAAVGKDAARAVVAGVVRLREAFPEVAFYARPVTDAGRRVLVERLGCVAVPESPLMVSPAASAMGAAA
jgi:hypothetical protein